MHWNTARPFVHPLVAPNGALLSVDSPADHPWHHGLWFTIKYVNGENFWEEYGEFGILSTQTVQSVGTTTTASIDWRLPNSNNVVIAEQRELTFVDLDADCYAIDWCERLTPRVDVVLDRTPFTTWGGYGGLTLRGAPTFVDTQLRTVEGVHERLLGVRSPWCAIDGTASHEDSAVSMLDAGVLMIDHPDNQSDDVCWYASTKADTYGEGWANFVNAAILWDAPMLIVAGGSLHLRYRVVVHDGRWDHDQCVSVAEAWRSQP